MKKLTDNITFTWNDADQRDWQIIQKLFVDAYISSYENAYIDELGLNHQHIEHASMVINKHGKNPEEIAKLIKLKALKLSFTEDFENEKVQILTQDQSNQYKIQYIIARTAFGYPIAFVACQLNYKTGHVYLRWVTVNPKVHGFGLGRMLLNNIRKRYDTLSLELYTRRANTQARGFYEHCGFSEIQLGLEEPVDSVLQHIGETKPTTALLLYFLCNKQLFPPDGEQTSHSEIYIGYTASQKMSHVCD